MIVTTHLFYIRSGYETYLILNALRIASDLDFPPTTLYRIKLRGNEEEKRLTHRQPSRREAGVVPP